MNKNVFSTAVLGLFYCLLASSQGYAQPLFVVGASAPQTTQDFPTNDGNAMLNAGFPNQEQTFVYGTLDASEAGTVTYTFLGSGAGYTNTFNLSTLFATNTVFNGHQSSVGDSVTQQITGAGALDFSFQTISPQYVVSNGSDLNTSACCGPDQGVFGIVTTETTLSNGESFSDLLIYNDPVPGGDHDYNDLVIGVNFVDPPPAVPEPASIALLGLGLSALLYAKRRNRFGPSPAQRKVQ
jgi:PEP-CTERM motif